MPSYYICGGGMNNNDEKVLKVLAEQFCKIQKEIKKNETRFEFATVTDVANKKYRVKINGNYYLVRNASGQNIKVGDYVVITIPNNNFSRMFLSNKFESE